jgi:hypothetical protein
VILKLVNTQFFMKLGGSLGNVLQKNEKLVTKSWSILNC